MGSGCNIVGAFSSGGGGGGATVTAFSVDLGTSFTTTSTTFVEITGSGVTKPTISGGQCLMNFNSSIQNSGNGRLYINIEDDSSIVNYIKSEFSVNADTTICGGDTSSADGQTYTLNTLADSGSTTIHNTNSNRSTHINGIGVG